jgi:crossover junction endodeoxyribonuclease RuvC
MRKAPTAAEARVWEWVRDARFGVRVRRQQPIAGFIVDFYVPALHLAIELDGASHEERGVADAARDEALALRGIRVVHLQNEEATEERLRSLITSPPSPLSLTSPPSPLSIRARGSEE